MKNDVHWMKRAYEKAFYLSQNPRTQTGAIIFHPEIGVLGSWANRFPCGIAEDKSKLVSPVVYDWLDHAEEGAIRMAVRNGYHRELSNSILYTPWAPCSGCARDIIGYGIPEVVMHKDLNDFDKTLNDKNWGQNISFEMFDAKGVKYRFLEGKLFPDNFSIKFRGHDFSP